MPSFRLPSRWTDCPSCYRKNALVLALTTADASLYCLGCERLFAAKASVSSADDICVDRGHSQENSIQSIARALHTKGETQGGAR